VLRVYITEIVIQ